MRGKGGRTGESFPIASARLLAEGVSKVFEVADGDCPYPGNHETDS